MTSRTLHVYRSPGGWIVKKEGKRADIFGTKKEALAMAVRRAKKASAAQIAVYGKDGRIVEHRAYGMPKILRPAKESPRAEEISRAVGTFVLNRLALDHPVPPRAHPSAR